MPAVIQERMRARSAALPLGPRGLAPEHEIDSGRIRFRNPDGSWGDWLTPPAGTPGSLGSARVKTTAAITLSGLQTIDGVSLVAGDVVLVANQADPVENGLWVVAAGAWTRATNADGPNELWAGQIVTILAGTANANKAFALIATNPVTPGTTPNTWQQTVILSAIGVPDVLPYNIAPAGGGADVQLVHFYTREVDVAQFGFEPADGPFSEATWPNNTGHYNDMLTWCRANFVQRVRAPGKVYRFAALPNPITFGLRIIGYGSELTDFVRTYSCADGLGLLHWTSLVGVGDPTWSNGAGAEHLKISGRDPADGGAGIAVVCEADRAIGRHSFENILITDDEGSQYWSHSMYLDGSLNDGGLGEGTHLRGVELLNCSIFGGRHASILVQSVSNFAMHGGFCTAAGGVVGKLVLAGTAALATQSVVINVPGIEDIQLGNFCNGFEIDIGAVVNVTFAGAVDGVIRVGKRTGSISGSPGDRVEYTEGNVHRNFRVESIVTGSLPVPSAQMIGRLAYVPDASGGIPTTAFCDGTNWRRMDTLAIIV